MTLEDAAWWAFLNVYHLDQANACMHCAPVRFSPITFRLAEALAQDTHYTLYPEVVEVMMHRGTYAEDSGR